MPVSDYFAELYVAGRFAEAGWNVYFPHRDKGFDFIVSRPDEKGGQLIRPIQVKGKYPTAVKTNKTVYGYVGRLTQLHPDMILAIPFFSLTSPTLPTCVAYMPISHIKYHSRGYRCHPETVNGGAAKPRREYAKYFDEQGLALVAQT